MNRRYQLGVDRGKSRERDIPTPESVVDDHAESVVVDECDIGRGFDNTASNKTSLPPGQFGGGEGVGEDVVVQTRDTAKPVNRDSTDFVEKSAQGAYQRGQVTYYPCVV